MFSETLSIFYFFIGMKKFGEFQSVVLILEKENKCVRVRFYVSMFFFFLIVGVF